ncbi:MAG TPA: DUF6194 family protein [Solirubrobacteraceae bacterium]|nr:DUF6194 family protein [Solirubrobacteraceae bacterium]
MSADPEALLDELAGCDPDLNLERYWGERSLFYNPNGERPLGIIWVSVKDHDGANDRSSNLDRDGVHRLSFQLSREAYERRFGPRPARPPKGGVVDIPRYDPTRLDQLLPHPVYAWMSWAMILSPSRAALRSLRAPMLESLDAVRARGRGRKGSATTAR